MGILKWIQVLKIALSSSHTQSLPTEIFQAHWSAEGRWQKTLEINTTKKSKEKIKINLGCIIEILKPRGPVSFFSMSKSPQAWRGSFSIRGRKILSPLCMQSYGSPEATPWPGPNSNISNNGLHLVFQSGKTHLEVLEPAEVQAVEGKSKWGHGGRGLLRRHKRKERFFHPSKQYAMAKGAGQAPKHSWYWAKHGRYFWRLKKKKKEGVC